MAVAMNVFNVFHPTKLLDQSLEAVDRGFKDRVLPNQTKVETSYGTFSVA